MILLLSMTPVIKVLLLCNKSVFLKQMQKLEEKERDLAKQELVYKDQVGRLEEKV